MAKSENLLVAKCPKSQMYVCVEGYWKGGKIPSLYEHSVYSVKVLKDADCATMVLGIKVEKKVSFVASWVISIYILQTEKVIPDKLKASHKIGFRALNILSCPLFLVQQDTSSHTLSKIPPLQNFFRQLFFPTKETFGTYPLSKWKQIVSIRKLFSNIEQFTINNTMDQEPTSQIILTLFLKLVNLSYIIGKVLQL